MTQANPPSIPVATSKTAALSRVLDVVPKGYAFYATGTVPAKKLLPFLNKLHDKYGIGCSPAQRLLRKKKGLANALMVVYLRKTPAHLETEGPPEEIASLEVDIHDLLQTDVQVSWLLLATKGAGEVWEEESLKDVREKPRLTLLGYELVQRPERGRATWTWRRPKEEMEGLYALLKEHARLRHNSNIAETLLRISRQPGFAGVRQQSYELCQFARSAGYVGELPFLFYAQKVRHGPLRLHIQSRNFTEALTGIT